MTGGSRSWDRGRVNVANVMGEECCWSTKCGQGHGYEAP